MITSVLEMRKLAFREAQGYPASSARKPNPAPLSLTWNYLSVLIYSGVITKSLTGGLKPQLFLRQFGKYTIKGLAGLVLGEAHFLDADVGLTRRREEALAAPSLYKDTVSSQCPTLMTSPHKGPPPNAILLGDRDSTY